VFEKPLFAHSTVHPHEDTKKKRRRRKMMKKKKKNVHTVSCWRLVGTLQAR
tara:strand:- start:598 stop:750 length:153 start_codon:yes stop_codon:yes gene_type:complete